MKTRSAGFYAGAAFTGYAIFSSYKAILSGLAPVLAYVLISADILLLSLFIYLNPNMPEFLHLYYL